MQSSSLFLRYALLFSLVALLTVPGLAQKSGGGKSGGGGSRSTSSAPAAPAYNPNYRPTSSEGNFDNNVVFLSDSNHPLLKNDLPSCFKWPMSPVQSSTVGVASLDLPEEARQQFTAGCNAVQKKKTKDAEHRLNRVVELSPKYAPAYVLLGQTNKDEGRIKEATDFCTQAKNADPSYSPAYLCLADLAAHQNQWTQVAELTDRVLGMHPVRAPGAYYYSALANVYLKKWPAAEQSALQALQDSGKQEKIELHWLLAKIYEGKNDRDSEAQHLRAYLDLAPNGKDSEMVRHILQQIEAHPAK
jgi:tetratricopeptide (TPR) repeat protein